MPTSGAVEVAADIIAAFVSNNSLPRGELPALIEAIHAAVKAFVTPGEAAAVTDPPVGNAGVPDLPGGRQTLQIHASSPSVARHDARAVPCEMGLAFNLSHDRGQLFGEAVGSGEGPRVWAGA